MIEERRGEYDDVKWPNCVPRASVIEGSFSNRFKREWLCTIPLSLAQVVSLKMYWRIFNMEFSLGCGLPFLVHVQSVIPSPWLSKQEIRKLRKKMIRKNGRRHLVNRRERPFIRRWQCDSPADRSARRRLSRIGKERKRIIVWKQLTDDI